MKFCWLASFILIVISSCNEKGKSRQPASPQQVKLDSVVVPEKSISYSAQDSVGLLKLAKDLYQWNQTGNNDDFFSPLQKETTDTVYAGYGLQI